MRTIIDIIFLAKMKKIKNPIVLKEVSKIKEEVSNCFFQNRFTKQYLDAFIDQYDNEQLYKIQARIKKKITERARKELNNEA